MSAPRDLEERLRDLGRETAWPATPDLRGPVLARIAGGPLPSPESGTDSPAAARRPRLRLSTALGLALLALLVLAGLAAALGFDLPGLEILRGGPAGGPGVGLVAVSELAVVPGSPVPLADARSAGSPRVLVPANLPEPSTAFVEGTGETRIVSLAWRAPAGTPAIEGSDLALVLMAAPGRIEEPLLTKVLDEGTAIAPVTLGGDRAWWISGAPHELFVAGPGENVRILRARWAGDTLVFEREGTVYRLESALGPDRTLEIAASLR